MKTKLIIINFLVILLLLLVVLYYAGVSCGPEEVKIRLLEFTLTGLATLLGVYLAFYLEKQESLRESSAREKCCLGLIWNELRLNKNTLRQIENNFQLKQLLTTGHLIFLIEKFNSLFEISCQLKDAAQQGILSSGFVKDIKGDERLSGDEVFNRIQQAYENCSYFKTQMIITNQDFENKAKLLERLPVNKNTDILIKQIDVKIDEAKSELNIAVVAVNKALDVVKSRLKLLGVTVEMEERKELLNQSTN